MQQSNSAYAIGIDIGTTSVKATLLHRLSDSSTRQLCSRSLEHHAYARGCGVRSGTTAQQDVPSLLHAVDEVMALLRDHSPAGSFAQAGHVGIACQMHGMVMWRSDAAMMPVAATRAAASETADGADSMFSPLVTWEDQRCSATFLQQLNLDAESQADPSAPSLSGQRLSNGFGMASLAHLSLSSQPQPLLSSPSFSSSDDSSRYHHAGTIGDLLVFLLTQQRVHAMDHTNAAAWGMYCMKTGRWHTDRIARARIPIDLLPPLVASSAPLGPICPRIAARWGLPAELRIHAAVGDHPASVYATLPLEHQLTVSIGTSSQISRVAQTDASAGAKVETAATSTAILEPPPPSAVERRPYICPFSQRTLLLCASLNGGNVLQSYVEGLERATRELNCDGDDDPQSTPTHDDEEQRKRRTQRMFARLIREASALYQQQADSPAGAAASSSLPTCDARFFGERSAPDARGSLSHLAFPLLSASQPLGGAAAIFLALCKGVIANLRNLIDSADASVHGSAASTHPLLRDLRSVRCVGAAMQRNPLLPLLVADVFGVPSDRVLVASADSAQGDADAAHGAALLALDWTATNSRLWESTT